MLDLKLLEALPRVPAPVLTVYLNTTPADLRNLRHPPHYLIRLKTQAKALEQGMQKAELRTFRELLQRVEEFLTGSPPQTRGLAIFVGSEYWQVFVLRVDTQDEIFWGLPELSQLFWLMEEHHLAGMVLADRDGALFYRYWMRELVLEHKEVPKINVWECRRKDLKPPSNPGAKMLRGSHRGASSAVWKRSMRASTLRKSSISGNGSSAGTWNQFSWRGRPNSWQWCGMTCPKR